MLTLTVNNGPGITDDFVIAAYPGQQLICIQCNGTKRFFRVEDDRHFAYKIMKTKIKAANGADGLYRLLQRCIDEDFAMCLVNKLLYEVFYHVKEAAV